MHDGESDDHLMARIGTGDQAAFGILVRRHVDRSLALAQRVTGSRADAEDVVQEAFLRVWTGSGQWRPSGPGSHGALFTTWLYRVVVNLCIDRKRRRRFAALEEAGDPVDPGDSADTALARARTSGRVAAAVAALPERQRVALALCFHEGLSNREAGEVMGLSDGAVESLLVRARRTLRDELRPLQEELDEEP